MLGQQKFALFFVGGEVQILTSDSKVAEWTRVNSIHIDDSEFADTMSAFRETVVAQSDGQNLVGVFLSEPDIFVSEVSILGRSAAAKQDHVNRTLARRMEDSADNIVAEFGVVAADKTAQVVYAAMDTLTQAQAFLDNYGLDAAYFAPRHVPAGFAQMPRLLSYIPPSIELHSPKAKAVHCAYLGSVAAMTCAAVLLFITSPNQLVNSTRTQTQIASVYSTRLSNLEYQPKDIVSVLPHKQSLASHGVFNVGDRKSRDLSISENVILAALEATEKSNTRFDVNAVQYVAEPTDMSTDLVIDVQQVAGYSLSSSGFYDIKLTVPTNDPWISTNHQSHNIDPVRQNAPDPEEILKLDILLKEGLFISIGQLQNLSLADSQPILSSSDNVVVQAKFAD